MESFSFQINGDEECWLLISQLQNYHGSNPIDFNEITKIGLKKALDIERKRKNK